MLCAFFSFWLKMDAARYQLQNGPKMSSFGRMGEELWSILCHFVAIGCSSVLASKQAKNGLRTKHGERTMAALCRFARLETTGQDWTRMTEHDWT